MWSIFTAPEERLVIEVDGSIHETQVEADKLRQQIIELLGIDFVRVSADQVEKDLPSVLTLIRSALKNETA